VSDKMSTAPVYYALVQARFNPVAAMDGYVSRIQDQLRQMGYPLFDTQQVDQLMFQMSGQEPSHQIVKSTSWFMTRSDRQAGFILDTSAITFQTTRYETHEKFIPELLKGLDVVHKVIKLDHVSRLGLRYLDAVLPKEGETLKQYLAQGVHGVDLDLRHRYSLNESVFETDNTPLVPQGTLMVRVYSMEARLGFPPDIVLSGLEVHDRFKKATQTSQQHAMIDTDHFVEGQMHLEPDLSSLEKQLRSMHSAIKNTFLATTTEYARNAWL
jgi:uncharacterized protein (TIGR04255 family)